MPAPVTLPLPSPSLSTYSGYVFKVKDAVTLFAWSIVTLQLPVPLQPPPDQPVNEEPGSGFAVMVIGVVLYG